MGQYAGIPANTPEALLTRMLAYAPSTPQAFIMLGALPDPAMLGRMTLLHRPTRFPVSVPATQWDETVMAFEGDVLGGQTCTAVEWPVTGFRQAANGAALQVPTLENLDGLFAADPHLETVGPFAANENGTELVRTRNLMCVPPRYVPLVLGRLLTPRDAYLRLSGAIRADGLEAACTPLLTYLRVACTLQTAALVPAVQRPAALVLRVDATMYNHIRDSIVFRDFPRLQEPSHVEPGQQVARAIGELVTEHRATRAEVQARRLEDATTTPEGKWGASLQLLVCLTQDSEQPTLPPFWLDLAAAPKRFESTTIARATDATAAVLGLAPDLAPIITPSLTGKITSFSFGHTTSDELE
jgi:hypothetical protein